MPKQCCEKHYTDEKGEFIDLEFEPADAIRNEFGWEIKRSYFFCLACEQEEAVSDHPWLRQEQAWSDVA